MIKNVFYSYIQVDNSENEQWSQLAIRVLQQVENEGILKPRVISINGTNNIVYSIDGLINDHSMIENSEKEHKKVVLEKFIDLVRFVDDSEFLKRHFILLNEEDVYWSRINNNPKFLVVPIERNDHISGRLDNDKWCDEFFLFVLRYIDNLGSDVNKDISQIKELCENHRVDKIDEIIELIGQVVSHNENSSVMGTVMLKYQGEYGHFALYDKEPLYKIGKSESCQGVISFNPTISREHCAIEYDGNCYFVMDLGSSNGTYLNGEKLMPDYKRELKTGDVIGVSNMEFVVTIEN